MPAILSAIVLPAVTNGSNAFIRLLGAACKGTSRYLGRRTAVACLQDLDDRELQDIGLARFQIGPAVYGLITRSGETDEGLITFAPAIAPRDRQRVPMMEVAPWS